MGVIQSQKNELSSLAKSLTSEKDRKKYIKVIEMSKIIQSKLDSLHQKSSVDVDTISSKRTFINADQYLYKKSSSSSLDFYRSSSQSISSDHTAVTNNNHWSTTTTSSSSINSNWCGNDAKVKYQFSVHDESLDIPYYKVIDRTTSLRLRSGFMIQQENRRPSADAILFSPKETNILKPAHFNTYNHNQKSNSFSPLSSSRSMIDDISSDEEDEEEYPSTIHIAVRKDASLYKIKKIPSRKDLVNKTNVIKPELISSPKTSCQIQADIDLDELPRLTRVYKKSHQSLKGLLKRSYQLNQYIVNKTNSFTIQENLMFFNIVDNNGTPKILLKLVIVSLDEHTVEKQKRFGFTFCSFQPQTKQGDAKFALAPDSLVKEALITWMDCQNEGMKGDTLLPSISDADDILRDGRKLYLIYNTNLFSNTF